MPLRSRRIGVRRALDRTLSLVVGLALVRAMLASRGRGRPTPVRSPLGDSPLVPQLEPESADHVSESPVARTLAAVRGSLRPRLLLLVVVVAYGSNVVLSSMPTSPRKASPDGRDELTIELLDAPEGSKLFAEVTFLDASIRDDDSGSRRSLPIEGPELVQAWVDIEVIVPLGHGATPVSWAIRTRGRGKLGAVASIEDNGVEVVSCPSPGYRGVAPRFARNVVPRDPAAPDPRDWKATDVTLVVDRVTKDESGNISSEEGHLERARPPAEMIANSSTRGGTVFGGAFCPTEADRPPDAVSSTPGPVVVLETPIEDQIDQDMTRALGRSPAVLRVEGQVQSQEITLGVTGMGFSGFFIHGPLGRSQGTIDIAFPTIRAVVSEITGRSVAGNVTVRAFPVRLLSNISWPAGQKRSQEPSSPTVRPELLPSLVVGERGQQGCRVDVDPCREGWPLQWTSSEGLLRPRVEFKDEELQAREERRIWLGGLVITIAMGWFFGSPIIRRTRQGRDEPI